MEENKWHSYCYIKYIRKFPFFFFKWQHVKEQQSVTVIKKSDN